MAGVLRIRWRRLARLAVVTALDIMVFSAERGSAWTLAYPQFSVVVPQPLVRSGAETAPSTAWASTSRPTSRRIR